MYLHHLQVLYTRLNRLGVLHESIVLVPRQEAESNNVRAVFYLSDGELVKRASAVVSGDGYDSEKLYIK